MIRLTELKLPLSALRSRPGVRRRAGRNRGRPGPNRLPLTALSRLSAARPWASTEAVAGPAGVQTQF